jgi:hypothetical protein
MRVSRHLVRCRWAIMAPTLAFLSSSDTALGSFSSAVYMIISCTVSTSTSTSARHRMWVSDVGVQTRSAQSDLVQPFYCACTADHTVPSGAVTAIGMGQVASEAQSTRDERVGSMAGVSGRQLQKSVG